MQEITIRQPDDWHIHLRDGDVLKRTVRDAAWQFNRAIIMPNLVPPIKNTAQAADYRQRILEHIPENGQFEPLMVLYLTDNTRPEDIHEAAASSFVKAVKLYPAGATTNSDSGVTNINKLDKVFDAMQKTGLPLLVHGEVTDAGIDIFDREKVFIETKLLPLSKKFPELKIVLEHITTKDAVEFVISSPDNIAATITAHHLLFNRNDMLAGGIRPHYYCLPVLKRMTHQQALIEAATSSSPKFFLGTDSAPHAADKKESSCGCAGCYTAYTAIELYAEAFDKANALEKLENFASVFGPGFYGLPLNENFITLKKSPWKTPDYLEFGQDQIKPLTSGKELQWQRVTGT